MNQRRHVWMGAARCEACGEDVSVVSASNGWYRRWPVLFDSASFKDERRLLHVHAGCGGRLLWSPVLPPEGCTCDCMVVCPVCDLQAQANRAGVRL